VVTANSQQVSRQQCIDVVMCAIGRGIDRFMDMMVVGIKNGFVVVVIEVCYVTSGSEIVKKEQGNDGNPPTDIGSSTWMLFKYDSSLLLPLHCRLGRKR
jgi:hypothetical protein